MVRTRCMDSPEGAVASTSRSGELVQDFSQGNPDNDDLTALVVKVVGQSPSQENRS